MSLNIDPPNQGRLIFNRAELCRPPGPQDPVPGRQVPRGRLGLSLPAGPQRPARPPPRVCPQRSSPGPARPGRGPGEDGGHGRWGSVKQPGKGCTGRARPAPAAHLPGDSALGPRLLQAGCSGVSQGLPFPLTRSISSLRDRGPDTGCPHPARTLSVSRGDCHSWGRGDSCGPGLPGRGWGSRGGGAERGCPPPPRPRCLPWRPSHWVSELESASLTAKMGGGSHSWPHTPGSGGHQGTVTFRSPHHRHPHP